jgi:protein MpaA
VRGYKAAVAALALFASAPAAAVGTAPAVARGTPPAAAPGAPPLRAEIIGRSADGRDLRLVRAGDPGAPRRILVVGCVHGNERAGLAVTRALRRLEPPAGTQLLILDALNPDRCFGRVATRGNARGVDLNRNFPRGWRELDGIFESGPRSSSEPETRAIERLILRERPSVSIWYHQALGFVDLQRGAKRSLMRLYARTAGMPTARLPLIPGTAVRWTNHRLPGRCAFVVELPPGRLSTAAVFRHRRAVAALAEAVAPQRARL